MRTFFQQTAASKQLSILISLVVSAFITACNPQESMIAPKEENSIDANIASRLGSVVIDSNSTLKSVASFPIGAAPASWLKKSKVGHQVLEDQFSSKTVHAYMNIETSRGKYDFSEPDYWIKWAETHPVRLHGHCLVYQGAAPEWILTFKGTTTEFEQVIKEHIQTIVGRYKGKIKSWDVVNELINDKDGTMFMRLFRKLYPNDQAYLGFVKRCFQWAHEADPDALLFYNDYGFEIAPEKVNGIIRIVEDFRRSGVPIHGIGTQMHISINTPNAGIRNSLRRLASTGLLIHISELDVMINPDNIPNLVFTAKLLDAQRDKFQAVAEAYKQLVPPQQQHGITVWDLCDDNSWIVKLKKQHDAPCLFDKPYDKKPAFYGFLQGLR